MMFHNLNTKITKVLVNPLRVRALRAVPSLWRHAGFAGCSACDCCVAGRKLLSQPLRFVLPHYHTAMADNQEEKLYKVEYAKSGRASCKKCKESIAKDSLRMATMVQSPMFDGKVPHWHHFSCFWLRAAPQSPADIAGFSDLRWEDQEKVKKAIESGGAVGVGRGDQKSAAKGEKTLNDFAVEYAKSNRSTCKGCEQKIEKDQIRVSKKTVDPEKPQLGLIDRWYHTACFVSRREELVFRHEYSAAQLKGFNALRAEDKEELKKRLPAVKSEG
ncbi:Poly [ADP-ribose] polymerase 1 [Ilyodon furcidens]|uniref:Poly [ADP-ribose] polymerase 1 n=1 Tax=Ilyodon furcidens TaxID=33524 RepID=A0ABV0SVI0_9TELE